MADAPTRRVRLPGPSRRRLPARGTGTRVAARSRSQEALTENLIFHRKAKYIGPRLALVRRIGFVVNPIAGLGGRVGFKGTDGVAEQALAAGAKPTAPDRARGFAGAFVRLTKDDAAFAFHWVTAGGDMGAGPFRSEGISADRIEVVHLPGQPSTVEDTKSDRKSTRLNSSHSQISYAVF